MNSLDCLLQRYYLCWGFALKSQGENPLKILAKILNQGAKSRGAIAKGSVYSQVNPFFGYYK